MNNRRGCTLGTNTISGDTCSLSIFKLQYQDILQGVSEKVDNFETALNFTNPFMS
jgi:hypothetical protein